MQIMRLISIHIEWNAVSKRSWKKTNMEIGLGGETERLPPVPWSPDDRKQICGNQVR